MPSSFTGTEAATFHAVHAVWRCSLSQLSFSTPPRTSSPVYAIHNCSAPRRWKQSHLVVHRVEDHFIQPCLVECALLGERIHLRTAQKRSPGPSPGSPPPGNQASLHRCRWWPGSRSRHEREWAQLLHLGPLGQ